MKLEFTFRTHQGKIRDNNEDRYASWNNRLFVVADGVGGYQAGEVAANLVCDTIIGYCKSKKELTAKHLESAFKIANRAVLEKANNDLKLSGMATTLSVVSLISQEGTFVNVGDTQGFLFRKHQLQPITSMDRDNYGYLTGAIGLAPNLTVHTESIKLKKNDIILLATDGLTDLAKCEQIAFMLKAKQRLSRVADQLIELALYLGGYDNITVCLLKMR